MSVIVIIMRVFIINVLYFYFHAKKTENETANVSTSNAAIKDIPKHEMENIKNSSNNNNDCSKR